MKFLSGPEADGIQALRTTIFPWVKVPVLSEQMSLQQKLEYKLHMVNRRSVRDTTEGFEGVETTDDDAVFGHPPGTSGHRDGQDGDQTLWNNGDGKGNSIDGHFLVNTESSGAKDYECKTTCTLSPSEQMHG